MCDLRPRVILWYVLGLVGVIGLGPEGLYCVLDEYQIILTMFGSSVTGVSHLRRISRRCNVA